MYLKLKVIAGAKKEIVEKTSENSWHVWVREEAEMNRANTRVLEIIREAYPNTSVRLISGHHSPSKIVAID